MVYRLEMTPRAGVGQGTGKLIEQASQYFGFEIQSAAKSDVLTIKANISEDEISKISKEIVNPVLQDGIVGQIKERTFDWFIAIGFLPGVTDNVARSAREAVGDIVGRSLEEDEYIFSSREFFVTASSLSREDAEKVGRELLGNVLIESVNVLSYDEWKANGAPENLPLIEDETEPEVHLLSLEMSDEELETTSKEKTLALTLREMKIIQEYIRKASDDPKRKELGLEGKITDAELECLAQTWSEHCKHKIFDAIVNYTDENGNKEQITSLFKSYIKKSTEEISEEVDWLVSVFHDNAGVISFNDKYDLVYKAETHNSPSALDPYGGAMTGIVGVNRDPLGTGIGSELLINTWGYCLGSPFAEKSDVPEGLLHPRRIRDGVHSGVIDGGNQSGVPYGLGWEYFDKRYIGKPLVYCGTVGLLPRQIHGQSGADKSIIPGDFIVMTGGRIGKDGIHGATFSSEELHKDSPVQAVQIGDPITQKKMYDFVIEARDLGLYRFVTDNGAGGLSSSIGEMSTQCGGCHMDLSKAPVKYAGLQPWEILVSEAQERMSFAVQPEKMEEFAALAAQRDVEISNLGTFNDSGKFHITYEDKTVCYLDLEFMHDGLPRMEIPAKWDAPVHEEPEFDESDISDDLVELLESLNITSNEFKCRQYDHEVKGLSVVKPFVGVNSDVQTDATVFMPEALSTEGIILASGIAPGYSDIDTYHMMASVMDLAIRRTIAVGGKLGHIAGLDNFCWPDPVESEKTPDGQYKMAQLVRANKALYDYSKAFGVPLISGKDSMKNDSTKGGKKISIPPTVLYSTIAKMDNIEKSVTLSAKRAGDKVYVIGDTKSELGGSQFGLLKGAIGNSVPQVDADYAISIYNAVSTATEKELCHSVHTPALGGLAVAFAKVAIAGQLGLDVDLNKIPSDDLTAQEILFSESNTRFVVTIAEESAAEFEEIFEGLPCACVGRVTLDDELIFRQGQHIEAAVKLGKMSKSYKSTLDNV
ncbi:MAG: AIR synthase-related protein [Lentisphaeraceae bacterium]|nr:AIR synthase-related protein [Lentisphaeraceae bacterium]